MWCIAGSFEAGELGYDYTNLVVAVFAAVARSSSYRQMGNNYPSASNLTICSFHEALHSLLQVVPTNPVFVQCIYNVRLEADTAEEVEKVTKIAVYVNIPLRSVRLDKGSSSFFCRCLDSRPLLL